MIRVMLVDDQTLVRQGVRSLLELSEEIEVIGEAYGGEQALELIPQLQPDVLLLDMRMPGLSGLEVLKQLRDRGQMLPTIILTTFDDDELLLESVQVGARGYLLKDVGLEELLEAVRSVAAGKTLVRPALTERLARGLAGLRNDFHSLPEADPLTERETEILRLLAGGYSNREIAGALCVAEGTVKNHVSNVLSKMGVRDRTRAVLKALESGLI